VMERIEMLFDKEQKFCESLDRIVDGHFICTLTNDLHAACIQILTEAMDDELHEWIDYYIHETDFGKYNLECTLNGKKITLRTVDDLYKLLTKKRK